MKTLVFASAFALLLLTPLRAVAEEKESPRFRATAALSAGPLIGLDRPLRGAAVGLGVGLAYGALEASLRAMGLWDAVFSAPALRIDLQIGLGPGLRFIVGQELALAPQSASFAGSLVAIAPETLPNRFGLVATIAQIAATKAREPLISLEAELSWTAYRASGRAGPVPAAAAGVAGFAAGFTAALALRLAWGGA